MTGIAWMYLHGVPVVVWVMHPHHVDFMKVSTGCRCDWHCMNVPAWCPSGCVGDASSSCRFHETLKVSTGCRCDWHCMNVPAGCTCGCMGDASSSCRFHESIYRM